MALVTNKYKDFSWGLHRKAKAIPLTAQIELTLRCPLRCAHCYANFRDNKAAKKELSTAQVKLILDKCKKDGVAWVCFTGGDPLIRKDFSQIYLYAKESGFIVTIFTSLILLDNRLLDIFKSSPPFCIETTLNAATPATYKEITKTDYFARHIRKIRAISENGIHLKIKTQVTRQNFKEAGKIKELVESLGAVFKPGTTLFARLNQDDAPCSLRIKPEEVVEINRKYGNLDKESLPEADEECRLKTDAPGGGDRLFSCALGNQEIWVSCTGSMFVCSLLRSLGYDLLKEGNTPKKGLYLLSRKAQGMFFKTKSRCSYCRLRILCNWCPAKAYLEKGNLEEPIDYFCAVAKKRAMVVKPGLPK